MTNITAPSFDIAILNNDIAIAQIQIDITNDDRINQMRAINRINAFIEFLFSFDYEFDFEYDYELNEIRNNIDIALFNAIDRINMNAKNKIKLISYLNRIAN
ncbi:MAG: hypothetical protein Q8S44_07305 [Flavobacteriaceae bacterium]|nr:hypothetical protein [Flavobacteriaceae bacterium]